MTGRAKLFLPLVLALSLFALASFAESEAAAGEPIVCDRARHQGARYAYCVVDPNLTQFELLLLHSDGQPIGDFERLRQTLPGDILMATNGGMYHRDRSPVGLFIADGVERRQISTRPGPGNFHLLPNGVFFVADRRAAILPTTDYIARDRSPTLATQSGPMLVIGGALHPKFLVDSDSFKRRSGVGVRADGKVAFVITDTPVRFYDFAMFFRDEMETPDALFLDGTISRFYAPSLRREDLGAPMGPIIAVTPRK